VAEHSFFVALLAADMSVDLQFEGKKRLALISMALVHDIAEAVTGDIGYLVKKHLGNISNIENVALHEIGVTPFQEDDQLVQTILFLDCYELKLYLEEERLSGNHGLWQIECETMGRLNQIDIGNKAVRDKWIGMLKSVPPHDLPEEMSH